MKKEVWSPNKYSSGNDTEVVVFVQRAYSKDYENEALCIDEFMLPETEGEKRRLVSRLHKVYEDILDDIYLKPLAGESKEIDDSKSHDFLNGDVEFSDLGEPRTVDEYLEHEFRLNYETVKYQSKQTGDPDEIW